MKEILYKKLEIFNIDDLYIEEENDISNDLILITIRFKYNNKYNELQKRIFHTDLKCKDEVIFSIVKNLFNFIYLMDY